MAKRIGGARRKTRHKLKKRVQARGKISIRKYMQPFKTGERVALAAESAVQKGMYFPRFHGRTGVVTGMQGECYTIAFRDGGKEKTVIAHPVHLRKVQTHE